MPNLFRQEYAKLTAILCRHFGLQHIQTAEDIASDTFLKAQEYWTVHGVPDNPQAWLYTVAKNKAKDHLRRQRNKTGKRKEPEADIPEDPEIAPQYIADSQLAMIFAVCDPANTPESQVCLALQILCGFSVEEIASAFLSNTETIKKRLYRARERLRKDRTEIAIPGKAAIDDRLDTVLQTVYLLFNEGYYSRTHDPLVRKDLCLEAIRLCLVLTDQPLTGRPATNALMALMCYQSSRLEARTDETGVAVLFDKQDRDLWDQTLIDKGHHYLVNAFTGNELSRYHLQAAIAYWHTTPGDDVKWPHILECYNQLIVLEYSPVTALNRIFALAKTEGHARAIAEAEMSGLAGQAAYHQLLGFLYAPTDKAKAAEHYETAIRLAKTRSERETLIKAIPKI